ncbi:MAG TPA: cysteine desulfurase family protein [Candidatus Limnocylindrales bacterium]|jgi:cysteine desulfurase
MTIYLDHAATTPMRREVLEAMLPLLTEDFGNPSSAHGPGRRARMALDEAHEMAAAALGAQPREMVFTAGGTEAANLAIKGAAWAGKGEGHRILTSAVEHDATLNALQHLEKFGFEVAVLPVDRYGRLDADTLDAALDERTILVALQVANNEVGTVQPLRDLIATVRRIRGRRTLVYVDAVQGAPYVDLDVHALDADLVAIGAHKFEGPKGTGALWIRSGTAVMAQTHGGGQERYRRAGTENVAGAVGMATALRLTAQERPTTVTRLRRERDRLRAALASDAAVEFTGHPTDRLPGHLSLLVRGVEGAAIVVALDLEGIAASAGAACTTGSPEVSHVLAAMGYPDEEARGALRLSLGRTTTEAEVERAAEVVPAVLARLRSGSSAMAADPLGQEIGV